MKKDADHNSTDSAEIEALITRIKRGQLRDEDAQLLARLLRLLLRLTTLLQQKNASLSRLKLREQVDQIAERGREMGILVEPPRDAGGSVGYFTMLRDPDGHLVEFTNGQLIEGLY